MVYNKEFRDFVSEKFNVIFKTYYLPDQSYITRLLYSLNGSESNSYDECQKLIIKEFKYLKKNGVIDYSIKKYVISCLNQLLWINSLLEQGEIANTEEEIEEMFDYIPPKIEGNDWVVSKVNNRGVYFYRLDGFNDTRIIINSENIKDIATSLSQVEQTYLNTLKDNHKQPAKKNTRSNSRSKESSLFKSYELQEKCLNVLKEIEYPILDVNGAFLGVAGMKGAIVVWFDKCKVLGFIKKEKKFESRNLIAKEVMAIIPNLEIEGSSFSKNYSAKKYKIEICKNLEQIHKRQ